MVDRCSFDTELLSCFLPWPVSVFIPKTLAPEEMLILSKITRGGNVFFQPRSLQGRVGEDPEVVFFFLMLIYNVVVE